jgi:hypothetical protein
MDFDFRYNPDADPLIQRARGREQKSHRWLWLLVAVLVGWIGYRELSPKLAAGMGGGAGSAPQLTSESALAGRPKDGPFQLAWKPQQKAAVGLSVAIQGKGNPALTGSTGLNLVLEADMTLAATDVDRDGNATLQLEFQDANLYGNHFGYPVNLQRRGGVVQSFAEQMVAAPAVTFANTKLERPDMSNMSEPIVVKLTPKGTPMGDTAEKLGPRVVISILALSGMQFPSPGLVPGDVWEREQELSMPGFKGRIPVLVRTTYLSDGEYWGRKCACLVSEIAPGKAKGKLAALGHVDVSGRVQAYYDLELRRVLCNEAELNFDLNLAAGLDAAAEVMGVYSGLLGDLEGGGKFDLQAAAAKKGPQEPLGFHVRSSMSFKG